MRYYVKRTYEGIEARAVPARSLPKDIVDTFSYALGVYGCLISINQEVSSDVWISYIEAAYDKTPRRDRVVRAIKIAMAEPHETNCL